MFIKPPLEEVTINGRTYKNMPINIDLYLHIEKDVIEDTVGYRIVFHFINFNISWHYESEEQRNKDFDSISNNTYGYNTTELPTFGLNSNVVIKTAEELESIFDLSDNLDLKKY